MFRRLSYHTEHAVTVIDHILHSLALMVRFPFRRLVGGNLNGGAPFRV
jgi:hypothetical protein